MIVLSRPSDLNVETVTAVAFEGARLEVDDCLLRDVGRARKRFVGMIERGAACYGVTSGLGRLAGTRLSGNDSRGLAHNILRARAVAFGAPLSREVVRALMAIRLSNFVSGLDGVRPELCRFLVDRLNDDFTPWVPSQGHGMAGDAIANTHAFQTFIGEGFVVGPDGARQPAAGALAQRRVEPMRLQDKEGLALISGLTATPAAALHAGRALQRVLRLANTVAAVSIEGLGARKDAVDVRLCRGGIAAGTAAVIRAVSACLAGSGVTPAAPQAPVSYRVVPQVHGALHDAIAELYRCIDRVLGCFTGNPMMVSGGGEPDALLSVGLFHDQHLANQLDNVALGLAHVGCLSERRLHRLLDPACTGLSAQLAARPGVDAGLVVAQKGSLGLEARLRLLAQPVSLNTGDTSAGQEDYMSMALPAAARLGEMAELVKGMLAYELMAGMAAIDQRGQEPGRGVAGVLDFLAPGVKPFRQDRSLGPDVEVILDAFDAPGFERLLA